MEYIYIDAPSGDPITTFPTSNDRFGGGMISNLKIETRLEYNETTVECGVIVDRGTLPQYTPTAKLLIQGLSFKLEIHWYGLLHHSETKIGIPGNVTNLVSDRPPSSPTTLESQWDSVFSLDLSDTDPDIVYSFEVYDITCGRNDLIDRKTTVENITSITIDPWNIYKAVVTPRNNVYNATDGTTSEYRGMVFFEHFQQ